MAAPADIDAYIAALPEGVRDKAEALRAAIKAAAPEAGEAIKYGMPAFPIAGKPFLFFGVWKKHIGLYPVYRGDAAFETRVGPYRDAKDTVKLMLDRPLPLDLVTLIVERQREAI